MSEHPPSDAVSATDAERATAASSEPEGAADPEPGTEAHSEPTEAERSKQGGNATPSSDATNAQVPAIDPVLAAAAVASLPKALRWLVRRLAAPDEPQIAFSDSASRDGEDSDAFPTDSDARAAALQAEVSHDLERPELIRQRAQNAVTIAALAAAALGAFGGIKGLDERSLVLKAIVSFAIAAWLCSVMLYIRAIGYSAGENFVSNSLDETLKNFRAYADKYAYRSNSPRGCPTSRRRFQR
jgi:hypothetical protein